MFARRWGFRLLREKKVKLAWGVFLLLLMYIVIDSCGVVEVIFEKDFNTGFSYPIEVEDFSKLVNQYRNGEQVDISPINGNILKIPYLELADGNCNSQVGMLILVKSAPSYVHKRNTIRQTWGSFQYLRNISNSIPHFSPLFSCFPGHGDTREENLYFSIKIVFLVGRPNDKITTSDEFSLKFTEKDKNSHNRNESTQFYSNRRRRKINSSASLQTLPQDVDFLKYEILTYNDIVLANFLDSYENNTVKTLLGLRWATEICQNYKVAFLVDDDMLVSMKNLIRFLENPKQYPGVSSAVKAIATPQEACKNQCTCNYLKGRLYAGKVLTVRPVRHKIGNKWYLSLDEYPYNFFPPYTPAGSVVMSKKTVEDFFYASLFTKPFRFDDVFLGMLAYKMNITPVNSDYFHVCHTPSGSCVDSYEHHKYVIARHGLSPLEVKSLWTSRTIQDNLEVFG